MWFNLFYIVRFKEKLHNVYCTGKTVFTKGKTFFRLIDWQMFVPNVCFLSKERCRYAKTPSIAPAVTNKWGLCALN